LNDPRVRDKANEVVRGAAAIVPYLAEPFPPDQSPAPPWIGDRRDRLLNAVAEELFSPFRGLMPNDLPDSRRGTPWIREETKEAVLNRQGISRQPASSDSDASPQEAP
jgi:hypothetical protein